MCYSGQLERNKNSSSRSSVPTPASHANSRRKATRRDRDASLREPRVKQEMSIDIEPLLREGGENGIDIDSDTPPDSPTQYSTPALDFPNAVIGNDDSEIIDLTTAQVIDLTEDGEVEGGRRNNQPHNQDSDQDSLFDGPEGHEDESHGGIDFDQDHLNWVTSETPTPPVDALSPIAPSTSNAIIAKRIYKRSRPQALDIVENRPPPKDKTLHQAKKRRIEPSNKTSLFTAVRGKVIVKGRDGTTTNFNATTSAGSNLAAKLALEKSLSMSSTTTTPRAESIFSVQTSNSSVRYAPVTNPDDLEDYEDEEQQDILTAG
jgi:hypothetical protein